MIKKFFSKILFIILILLMAFLIYQYIQYKNVEKDEVKREIESQNDSKLQQEVLNKEIKNAENYIQNINNNIAITTLRLSGKYKMFHDKTPDNNAWTEWLFNSDITIYADYTATFIIETSDIDATINEDGTVLISYDEHDIKLSSIDLTDYTASNNTSFLGSSYSPTQMAAFERIARNSIKEKINNEKNIAQAKLNLNNYLTDLSNKLNVKINIIEN